MSKKDRKIKVGVVGCGVIANQTYFPYLKDHSELVAVCDIYEARTAAAMKLYGAKEQYNDYDEMLEKADIEAVFVLTGPGTHARFTAKAARAGKHVLVQKPLATNMQDANEAVKEVRKNKVKALVEPSLCSPLNPSYPPVKKLIDEGVLGQPLWFLQYPHPRAERFNSGGAPPHGNESFYKDGPIFDMTYYPAQITSLLGSVKSVTGLAKTSVPNRFIYPDEVFSKYILGLTDLKEVPSVARKSLIGFFTHIASKLDAKRSQAIEMQGKDNVFSLYEMANGALGCYIENWCRFHPAFPGITQLGLQVYGTEGNLMLGGGYFASFVSKNTNLLPKIDEDGWYHIKGGTFGQWGGNEYYPYSTQHLFDCILADTEPVPSIEWGRHVSEMMIGALESSRTGRKYVMTTTF